MPTVAATVWTNRRKWMGNLLPALFWFPLACFGIYLMLKTQVVVGPPLYYLAGATATAWVAVNFLGLYQNARMKRQLQLIVEARGESIEDGPFVGYATPHYSSLVDPHEQVGFLRLYPDRLSIVTEHEPMEVMRDQVDEVRFRANVHTMIGLGRWVSVEGNVDGKRLRLLIEPREKNTLLGNLLYSKLLAERLSRWVKP
jgi:hypothetical protein